MAHILDTLIAVGLGTIRLDQPATTLSGGEGCGLCPSCAAKHAAALAAFLRVEVTLFATILGAASSAADYASSARRSRWWRNFDSAA